MSENLNEYVIVAFYESEDAADKAAKALMGWDEANDDIKLGSIGRITLKKESDKEDKVEIARYGTSNAGRGAVIGSVLGFVAAGVTGGLSLLVGAVGGGAIGGVVGKLDKNTFGLSDSALEAIKAHLETGGAGLVVLCDDFEVEPTMKELEKEGGSAQSFGLSTKVLKAMHDSAVQEGVWDMQTKNIERFV